MENDLGSILSEEPTAPVAETPETVVPEQETPPEHAAEVTGEESAPPAPQEDPVERHRKGLEAAALAERRRRQELERELQQLREQVAHKPAQPEGAPDPSQYTDSAAYVRDLARYEAGQVFQQERQKYQEAEQVRAQNAQQAAFMAKADSSVAMGQAKYADFDAAINSGLAPFLNQDMQRALVLSKDGHDIAYFLAKNPAEASRIAGLSPLEMAMEIGELRTKVKAPVSLAIPQTLTQARDSRGQFNKPNAYTGPTPLDDILTRR